jgi:hypothetical protein
MAKSALSIEDGSIAWNNEEFFVVNKGEVGIDYFRNQARE